MRIFLVNTMFTKANNMQLIMDKQDYIESLIKNGHKPDSLKVKYAKVSKISKKKI